MDNASRKQAERRMQALDKQWKQEKRSAKIDRFFGKKPRQYKKISVPDWDERTKRLSDFRKVYSDFFRESVYSENSDLQMHSTQLFWHRLYLQKLRMKHLGITMEMESQRVECSNNPKESVIHKEVFDGRYTVSEINETIYAKRSFMLSGKEIGSFRDFDSVNYSILSVKQQGEREITCPNCGNVTTRENLIDGCDYCETKFTIDDLEDHIGGFDFQIETVKPTLSKEARDAGLYFDDRSGEMVREYDPNFSFRHFRTNVYNMLAAIHYADSCQQINAFSPEDFSPFLKQYENIVNIDFVGLRLFDNRRLVEDGLREKNDYYIENGMQTMKCTATVVLFCLVDGKIQLCNEVINLELEKSAECKTQNVCGPSVFRCRNCGNSLSLMEGKTCQYCGSEIDMRNYDWVITKYRSNMSAYGESFRVYN